MTVVITCFFFQAEDGIRDGHVTGVQTCALPICLPITPEFKANLTARLNFPLGAMEGFGQISGVYNGDSYSDLQRSDRETLGIQPSYTTADFSAGVTRDSWTVQVYVNNLTDERARLGTFAQCATEVCGVNPYYMTNQPRTYGLKFGQRF